MLACQNKFVLAASSEFNGAVVVSRQLFEMNVVIKRSFETVSSSD